MTAVQFEYELLLKHKERILVDLAAVEQALDEFIEEHEGEIQK